MKTIGCMKELLSLDCPLALHILMSCPWLAESWDVEDMGYIFIIDDSDIGKVKSVYTTPHLPDEDESYKEVMTIELESFELWETPAFNDPDTGYWNATAIFGADFGCTIFMSSGFVDSLPGLKKILTDIQKVN